MSATAAVYPAGSQWLVILTDENGTEVANYLTDTEPTENITRLTKRVVFDEVVYELATG